MLALLLPLLFTFSSAMPLDLADCPFPNGSETQMHTYECDGNQIIKVNYIDVADDNGNNFYPIDPQKPFVLTLHSYNNGDVYTDNKVNVKIFLYATSWNDNSCHWNEIPTLGLLSVSLPKFHSLRDNIDGCDFAHNCPLAKGQLDLKIRLDLTQFSAIINLLAKGKPYELDIRMYNANPGNHHEEIACVKAQVHIV